nr:MAG TPA: hypothetical protein [Caudoviricetes sp.]
MIFLKFCMFCNYCLIFTIKFIIRNITIII